ncbi:hypothetical protein EON65_11745 [archaeon]|nr:MAG: hypothetical protein EON65_11745 [archaeon]
MEAVDEADIKLGCRYEHLLEECVKRGILDKNQCKQFAMKQDQLKQLVTAWKLALVKGDKIEVHSENESAWFTAKVLSDKVVDGQIKVHYVGWSKYDGFISLQSKRVQPDGCLIITEATKKTRTAPQVEGFAEDIIAKEAALTQEEDAPADEELLLGSNGRPVRKSRGGVITPIQPSPQKHEKKAKKSQAKSSNKEISEDNYDSFCALCDMRENACALDPLMCEGSCLRIFHRECLDLSDEPEHWYCDQCSTGKHACFICGVIGEDYSEVFKCNIAACGKYYHPRCLQEDSQFHLEVGISLKFDI